MFARNPVDVYFCLYVKDLEAELVAKEEQLTTEMDAAQEKGQTGFLRVAATMENLRKKTTKGSGHYEMEAKADVLTAVLPVFAAFEAAETVRPWLHRAEGGGGGFSIGTLDIESTGKNHLHLDAISLVYTDVCAKYTKAGV